MGVMPCPKAGTTHYNAQLGLPVQRLCNQMDCSLQNGRDLVPVDLLAGRSGPSLFYPPFPEVSYSSTEFKDI